MLIVLLFALLISGGTCYTQEEYNTCERAQAEAYSNLGRYNARAVGLGVIFEGGIKLPGTVGLIFTVTHKLPSPSIDERIPRSIGGCRTDVMESPPYVYHKLMKRVSPFSVHRPVLGGIAIGTLRKEAITGFAVEGTLGVVLRYGRKFVGVTTGHNLIIDGNFSEAVQPSMEDPVSAAVITQGLSCVINDSVDVCCLDLVPAATRKIKHNDIFKIGRVGGVAEPQFELLVMKFGIATGLTVGEIIIVRNKDAGATSMNDSMIVRGLNGPFSEEGDSGAIVLSAKKEFVGMVRGGAFLDSG